jgi:hypothetical protein
VQAPAAVQATVPCAAMGEADVTVSGSPSGSASFASTPTVAGVSSAVVSESGTATGASLTGVTVTVTCPMAVPPWPSPTV